MIHMTMICRSQRMYLLERQVHKVECREEMMAMMIHRFLESAFKAQRMDQPERDNKDDMTRLYFGGSTLLLSLRGIRLLLSEMMHVYEHKQSEMFMINILLPVQIYEHNLIGFLMLLKRRYIIDNFMRAWFLRDKQLLVTVSIGVDRARVDLHRGG